MAEVVALMARRNVHSVTPAADNKIQDLEAAFMRMLSAKTQAEKDAAYSNLNECRRAIYEHIAVLEKWMPGVRRTVHKRF